MPPKGSKKRKIREEEVVAVESPAKRQKLSGKKLPVLPFKQNREEKKSWFSFW